jgi:hypothetical protein
MNVLNKSSIPTFRPRSTWRQILLLSLATFVLTVGAVSFLSWKFRQKDVSTPSKAVAVVEQKPATGQAEFQSRRGSHTAASDFMKWAELEFPLHAGVNLNSVKTRVLSPAFLHQTLCDCGIEADRPSETGGYGFPFTSQEQLRQGLNVRVKRGTAPEENQIILELTLPSSADAARIVRAMADRLAREFRNYWADETRKAYLAASDRANQAQYEHRQAMEMLRAFENNVAEHNAVKQEKPAQAQPLQTDADRPSSPSVADNPDWIELDRKLKSLKRQEAAMLVNKTPLHPAIQNIRDRIADLERKIADTPRLAAESQVNSSTQDLISTVKDKITSLNEKIRKSESSQNIAAADQTAETLKHLKYAVEHAEREYQDKLLSEQKLFEISRKEPVYSVSVEQISAVKTPPGSSRRFRELMLFSGFAMALGTGVFSSGLSIQPVLATIADLEPFLSVPIIGVIPGNVRQSNPIARCRRRAVLRWMLILLGGMMVLGCIAGLYFYFIRPGNIA